MMVTGYPLCQFLSFCLQIKNTIIFDEIKIVSTHSRKNAKIPGSITQTQNFINNNDILYINLYIKRTDNWLKLNRLQLPLNNSQYGPIKSVSYPDTNVKTKSEKNSDLKKVNILFR